MLLLRIDISVPDGSLDDEQIARLAQAEATVVHKLANVLLNMGVTLEEFCTYGARMSLKLD